MCFGNKADFLGHWRKGGKLCLPLHKGGTSNEILLRGFEGPFWFDSLIHEYYYIDKV